LAPSISEEYKPLLQPCLRRGGGAGRRLFRRLLRGQQRADSFHVLSAFECGGPGDVLRLQFYNVATAVTTEVRVSPAERAFLLPPLGNSEAAETDRLSELAAAVLQRAQVDEERGEVVWDVSLPWSLELDLPRFGHVDLRGGLRCADGTFDLEVQLMGQTRRATLPAEEFNALAETLGWPTGPALRRRYLEDEDFRSLVLGQLTDVVQEVMGPLGSPALALVYGSAVRPLFLEDATSRVVVAAVRSEAPAAEVEQRQLVEANASSDAPVVLRSLAERRMLLRVRTSVEKVEEGLDGEMYASRGPAEARVWEMFTADVPRRVYQVMVIDHELKGVAVGRIIGLPQLKEVRVHGPSP
jgi:hypothetical protein